MKPSPETPVPFHESLPPAARHWCWLPWQIVSLTGPLPHGWRTESRIWRCPYAPPEQRLAENVAHISTEVQA